MRFKGNSLPEWPSPSTNPELSSAFFCRCPDTPAVSRQGRGLTLRVSCRAEAILSDEPAEDDEYDDYDDDRGQQPLSSPFLP